MILTHICITVLRFITLLHIYYTFITLCLIYSWWFLSVVSTLDSGKKSHFSLTRSPVCVCERETVLMLFLVRFLHIKDKTAETEAGFLSLCGCLLCKCLSSCLTNWIHTWGGGHSSAAMLSLSGSFWPPAETVTPAVTPQTWREGAALPPLLHSSAEETLEPPLGKDRR